MSSPASSDSPAAPRASTSLAWLKRLARKELLEILRDRRTIITLVLMPLLVYPLLSVAFRTLALNGAVLSGAPTWEEWYIEFANYEQALVLDQMLDGAISEESTRSSKYLAEVENVGPQAVPPPSGPVWRLSYQGDDPAKLEAEVRRGIIDLGVRLLPPPEGQPPGPPFRVELYSTDSPKSRDAREWFQTRLQRVNDNFRVELLHRLNQKVTTLIEVEERRPKSPAPETAISFAALMPLILVLMTITGAVYPAIDLTAGERERNTLEALIASPAPRFALLLAKYSAVLTVAMLTALMNLTAMSVTIWLLGLGRDIFGPGGFSFLSILQVGGLLMLFAAFFSGVLLAVTSFARSFKEAQAYLIPLMLVALAPGMMSLMPGIKLQGPLVVAPLINLVLLTRDLLLNKASHEIALLVVISNVLYAMAAVALAARVFGADSVLYGRDGSWAELFQRPRDPSSAPSVSTAFFCLAALFVLTFLAQSAFAMFFRPAPGQEVQRLEGPIIASGLGNLLIFGGVCLFFGWLGRVSFSAILPLRAPTFAQALAALILGLCSWPLAHEILAWMNDLGVAAVSHSQLMRTAQLMEKWGQVSLVITLLSIAVITPLGEEIAFRGYLYAAFQSPKRPWRALLISSVLFAAFHVVAPGVLSFERFFPSLFLGLLLGYLRLRSGSILPSLGVHILHNGLLLTFLAFRDDLKGLGLDAGADTLHLPPMWGLLSILAVAVAVAILWRPRREIVSAAA